MIIHIKIDTDKGTVDMTAEGTSEDTPPQRFALPSSDSLTLHITKDAAGGAAVTTARSTSQFIKPNISLVKSQAESLPRATPNGGSRTNAPSKSRQTPVAAQSPTDAGEKTLYGEFQTVLASILKGIQEKRRIPLDGVYSMVDRILSKDEILESLYSMTVTHQDPHNSLSAHMLNVAVIATKIGNGLELSREKLRQLALAALLHDVGMCLTPKALRYKAGRLQPDEVDQIRQHPALGEQVIRAHLGSEFDWLGQIVRQEHERENGAGYPNGLSGGKIHVLAKIIGIADVYEAMTGNRPHRPGIRSNQAIKEIIVSQKDLYPARILKVLLQQLSFYPLHSLVRLNTNGIARVVEVHPEKPLRPTVQLVCPPNGRPVESGPCYSLLDNPLLYILDSVDEERFLSSQMRQATGPALMEPSPISPFQKQPAH